MPEGGGGGRWLQGSLGPQVRAWEQRIGMDPGLEPFGLVTNSGDFLVRHKATLVPPD